MNKIRMLFISTLFFSFFAEAKNSCPVKIDWQMEKVGTLESANLLGSTDFNFVSNDEFIVLNFPPEGKEQAPLHLYRLVSGKWVLDKKASSKLPPTYHPRQIIMDDIEGDGIKEVIISDHGIDKPPYPGSIPVILKRTKNEWMVDESSKRLPPAFTFNSAVLPLEDKTNALYFANVSFETPALFRKTKKNTWEDLSKIVPPELGKQLCLMTALKEDFDQNGIPDLFLGGCDRPKERIEQKHDRIFFSIKKEWKLLPPEILPPRKHSSMWGTNFAKSVDLNGDKKPDIIYAIHDWGFHHWELWAYENQSKPWKFNFKEMAVPVKQEPQTEGFIYAIEDFSIEGLGTGFITQVRSVIRDRKNKDPEYKNRLFIRESNKFTDISACLPGIVKNQVMHARKLPGSSGKLLLMPFKGDMYYLSGRKKQ
jgi:hypothetical protein